MCRYFVAYTFDTTLGVALAIGIHTGAVRIAKYQGEGHQANPKNYWKLMAESGNYGVHMMTLNILVLDP